MSDTMERFLRTGPVLGPAERAAVSVRTKDGLHARRSRGEIWSNPPLGLNRCPGCKVGLVLNENELRARTAIVYLKDQEKKSWRAIAAALNRMAYPTKHGGPWIHTSVQSVYSSQSAIAAVEALLRANPHQCRPTRSGKHGASRRRLSKPVAKSPTTSETRALDEHTRSIGAARLRARIGRLVLLLVCVAAVVLGVFIATR